MELKAGYVVEFTNGDLAMVCCGRENNDKDVLCISSPNNWFAVECLNEELEYDCYSIQRVYGRACNRDAHMITKGERKLLWTKQEIIKMTRKDVERILGHKFKLID